MSCSLSIRDYFYANTTFILSTSISMRTRVFSEVKFLNTCLKDPFFVLKFWTSPPPPNHKDANTKTYSPWYKNKFSCDDSALFYLKYFFLHLKENWGKSSWLRFMKSLSENSDLHENVLCCISSKCSVRSDMGGHAFAMLNFAGRETPWLLHTELML